MWSHCVKFPDQKSSYIWMHSNNLQKHWLYIQWNVLYFCALEINASNSFPLMIYSLDQKVSFSLSRLRLFPLLRKKNDKKKELKKHMHLLQIVNYQQISSWSRGEYSFCFCFGGFFSLSFASVGRRQSLLSWQICMKFHGDYQCKNTLAIVPSPVCQWYSGIKCLQIFWISLQYYKTVMEITSKLQSFEFNLHFNPYRHKINWVPVFQKILNSCWSLATCFQIQNQEKRYCLCRLNELLFRMFALKTVAFANYLL